MPLRYLWSCLSYDVHEGGDVVYVDGVFICCRGEVVVAVRGFRKPGKVLIRSKES